MSLFSRFKAQGFIRLAMKSEPFQSSANKLKTRRGLMEKNLKSSLGSAKVHMILAFSQRGPLCLLNLWA